MKESVVNYPFKQLRGNREKGDWSIVGYQIFITRFEHRSDVRSFPFRREDTSR